MDGHFAAPISSTQLEDTFGRVHPECRDSQGGSSLFLYDAAMLTHDGSSCEGVVHPMRTPFARWRFVVVADHACLGLALTFSARRFLCCLHNRGKCFD